MDNSTDAKVQCGSCGFLAKFDLTYSGPPPYIYEFPNKDRESGLISPIRLEAAREIYGFAQCYVNADDILGECQKEVQSGSEYQHRRQVFAKDRDCPRWHQYTPGLSPQQHLEEERVLELELKRQQFEQKMVQDHKDFMSTIDANNKCFQLKVTCVLGFIAVVEIIVTGLQLLYPTGLPWFQTIPKMPGF